MLSFSGKYPNKMVKYISFKVILPSIQSWFHHSLTRDLGLVSIFLKLQFFNLTNIQYMLATLIILSHLYISKEAIILTVLVRVSSVSWSNKQFQHFKELNPKEVFPIHVTGLGVEVVPLTSVEPRLFPCSGFFIFYGLGVHHVTLSFQPAERKLRRLQEIYGPGLEGAISFLPHFYGLAFDRVVLPICKEARRCSLAMCWRRGEHGSVAFLTKGILRHIT